MRVPDDDRWSDAPSSRESPAPDAAARGDTLAFGRELVGDLADRPARAASVTRRPEATPRPGSTDPFRAAFREDATPDALAEHPAERDSTEVLVFRYSDLASLGVHSARPSRTSLARATREPSAAPAPPPRAAPTVPLESSRREAVALVVATLFAAALTVTILLR